MNMIGHLTLVQSDPNKLDTNLHDSAEDDKMGASCVEDDCYDSIT